MVRANGTDSPILHKVFLHRKCILLEAMLLPELFYQIIFCDVRAPYIALSRATRAVQNTGTHDTHKIMEFYS